MLTAEQLKQREGKLTASRVGVLMSGSDTAIYDLWREMVGDPEYQPVDLSGIWPVALGSHTEALQLDWYERKRHHEVTRRGEVVVHPDYEWAAATLDGWDNVEGICIECKHVGGREPLATILARYSAQFHWQMAVTKTSALLVSIIEGANEPIIEPVTYSLDYGDELWRRAEDFIRCVEEMRPPIALPDVAPPIVPAIEYDMTGNNAWADFAVTWLETREAKKQAERAEKELKSIVPADGKRVFGHGVEITRDRANRMSLRAA